MNNLPSSDAVIVSLTRRHAAVLKEKRVIDATLGTKALGATVGDRVELTSKGSEFMASTILPRRNLLSRSYQGRIKEVAANLDLLLIITAVKPLFNTFSIDRTICVASSQDIPFIVLMNKVDLGINSGEREALAAYSKDDFEVLSCSAKFGHGMSALRERLTQADLRTAALCGVSGVGKSTIINALLPNVAREVSAVSPKTGQGRQTTSQASGFVMERGSLGDLLIIDLPGIQSFGVEHLEKLQVVQAFPEILAFSNSCRFSNCLHLKESDCAVKLALSEGRIPIFRYDSYKAILEEISNAAKHF